jgi:hypothetical protein
MAELSGSLHKVASSLAVTAKRHIYPQFYPHFCGKSEAKRSKLNSILCGMIVSAEILRAWNEHHEVFFLPQSELLG